MTGKIPSGNILRGGKNIIESWDGRSWTGRLKGKEKKNIKYYLTVYFFYAIIGVCGGDTMKRKKIIPICPKCGSKEIRARIKTGELWCRRCGYVGKREEFFKNSKE